MSSVLVVPGVSSVPSLSYVSTVPGMHGSPMSVVSCVPGMPALHGGAVSTVSGEHVVSTVLGVPCGCCAYCAWCVLRLLC